MSEKNLVWHKGFIVAERLPEVSYLIRFLRNNEGRLGPSEATLIMSAIDGKRCEAKALCGRSMTIPERRDLGEFGRFAGFDECEYERFDNAGFRSRIVTHR